MNTALRAEWTKLRTTPGPAWLLLITAVVTVALSIAVTSAATCLDGGDCDTARLALSGVYLGQAPIAVLGVLAISGEFSTALIGATLAAIPDRRIILAAKAAVLVPPVAGVGGLSVLACLLLAGTVRPDGPVLRAGLGTVAYLILVTALSLGVAAVVRDSATAIGTVLGLLYLPPILAPAVANPHLHRLLEQAAPMTAGLSVQATTDLYTLPIGPWAGLGVLTAWAAGALVAGTFALRFRDTRL